MPVATPTSSDETLMALVQAGDLDQLGPLFERYHGPLFGFLCRLNGGDADAGQDLTQNVFYRVLKYRASYRPGQPVRAWLYQLARHAHADHWQRQAKASPAAFEEAERSPAHGRSAQAQFAAATRDHALQEALALLPAAQREVLVLHRFEGFSYAEIGGLLGCSEGAARVKAHRALEDLRKIYFA